VFFTVAFPRLRPAAGGFMPEHPFTDRDLLQTICAFRIAFPEAGIVLSTREPAPLRDALSTVGVTSMSAGSHTEPGGYTGQGCEDLHLTVKGRRIERETREESDRAEGQFGIADERSPSQVAGALRSQGLDPVWKDWDAAILSEAAA
jgi:2-iminoacetate synthase